MRYSKSEFFFEVLKILAVFGTGFGLAHLAGAPPEKAILVGLLMLCGYLLGAGPKGP